MELRELTQPEQKYTYRQSHQLGAQTGCIGYLRGDFGSTGKEFYSSWFDNMAYLKTPEFQAELDTVVNALRESPQYGGILADRNSLSDVCRQSTTPKFGWDESGFRVNTQDYAYLLRLNPSPGDYNFYVYCYKRDYLDRNMRNAEHGIRFITPSYKEKFRIADGDSIRITFSSGETQDRPCRYVDETHLEVGNNLYHICEFAERMQHGGILVIPLRQSLPEKCFSALESTGEIITITKGENGYTPTGQYPQEGVSPKEAAAALNDAAGVTKAQEAAMVAGSMFGWDTPAADPKNYDAKGVPIKNHRERDAR